MVVETYPWKWAELVAPKRKWIINFKPLILSYDTVDASEIRGGLTTWDVFKKSCKQWDKLPISTDFRTINSMLVFCGVQRDQPQLLWLFSTSRTWPEANVNSYWDEVDTWQWFSDSCDEVEVRGKQSCIFWTLFLGWLVGFMHILSYNYI